MNWPKDTKSNPIAQLFVQLASHSSNRRLGEFKRAAWHLPARFAETLKQEKLLLSIYNERKQPDGKRR